MCQLFFYFLQWCFVLRLQGGPIGHKETLTCLCCFLTKAWGKLIRWTFFFMSRYGIKLPFWTNFPPCKCLHWNPTVGCVGEWILMFNVHPYYLFSNPPFSWDHLNPQKPSTYN
jgi:hypothetical protein